MLVLKRKVGESLILGDEIEVQVLAVEGDTVKIGINAPKHVSILRKELYDMIREENRHAAAQLPAADLIQRLMKPSDKSGRTDGGEPKP